ncbi:MAG TPA: LamG-like jellyroll fold domain-containing protein [Terracidiphilus sp.]|nr:LamG-like jellyroll fold domain-containing protein [Terracidiphilus sp.]
MAGIVRKCSMRLLWITAFAIATPSGAIWAASTRASAANPVPHTVIWRFDRTDLIGGQKTSVFGHPGVVKTRYGNALQFNGVDDAVIIPQHPLAGASTYTWEVIFRPDGGSFAQRFFHLQEQDPATGQDTGNRMLFEIRVVKGQWCLDSFASSGENHRTLLNCKLLHPLGKWYVVTAVYDGKELRNYVDGQLQGEGSLHLKPQLPGRSSVGMRINRKFFFKGAILMARMTPRALPPGEFLKLPPQLNGSSVP